MRQKLFFVLAALGAAPLVACAPKPVPFTARLVTQSCMSPSPMEGVTHFRFRVTGDGMTPLVIDAPINAHAQTLPDLPVGTHRVLEVRGYAGDPETGARVVSVGRSLPFEVPKVAPTIGNGGVLQVALRRVNVFQPPNLVGSPTQCTQLTAPRAGQTATLLSDGRVFIAGGYQLDGSGGVKTLASTEFYDPSTGAFTPGPDVGVTNSQKVFTPSPRAFHTATLLPKDQILLAGGESVQGGETTVLDSAAVFDALTHGYGALPLHAARSHASAAADALGHVLLVGGVDGSGAAVAALESYDATTGETTLLPDALPRIGSVAMAVGDGSTVAVVGGTDGTTLALDVPFFSFDGTALAQMSQHATLIEGRRSSGGAPFRGGGAVLVVGGFADANPAQTLTGVASTEQLQGGAAPTLVEGPSISGRGDLCAAALAEGQVLAAGGRTASGGGQAVATDQVELVTVTPGGDATALGMPPLPEPRWQHTCTALADGSVLILGGLDDSGAPQVLQDAEIFMPAPRDE